MKPIPRVPSQLTRPVVAMLLLVVALTWALAVLTAMQAADCGLALGQPCATDTECECMHGADK